MKISFLLLFTLLFLTDMLQAQKNETPFSTITLYDSLDVQVIKKGDEKRIDYYLVSKGDSILFRWIAHRIDRPLEGKEVCKVSLRQLDQSGRPEVILDYSYNAPSTSDASMDIFNLDTQQRIFYGQYSYFSLYSGEELASCSGYTYTITFDDQNNIIIKYPNHPRPCMKPGEKEGIYAIVDGQYIWVKGK